MRIPKPKKAVLLASMVSIVVSLYSFHIEVETLITNVISSTLQGHLKDLIKVFVVFPIQKPYYSIRNRMEVRRQLFSLYKVMVCVGERERERKRERETIKTFFFLSKTYTRMINWWLLQHRVEVNITTPDSIFCNDIVLIHRESCLDSLSIVIPI